MRMHNLSSSMKVRKPMSKEENPVQQTIDFSAIIDMVDEWCRLTDVDPFDFIDFYREVKEEEFNEEIDE